MHYHELYIGKPTADVYIDDKAVNSAEWKRKSFQIDLLGLANRRTEEDS